VLERSLHLVQGQLQLIPILAEAEELKEYSAPWLKKAQVITRDGTGKFASKASESAIAVGNDNSQAIHTSVLNLLQSGSERLRDTLNDAFGSGADSWRSQVAQRFSDLGSDFKKAVSRNPFANLDTQAQKLVDDLDNLKGEVIDNVSENKLANRATALFTQAQKSYHKAIQKIDSIEGTPGKIIDAMGEIAAKAVPIAVMWTVFGSSVSAGVILGSMLSPVGQALIEVGGGPASLFLRTLPGIIANAIVNAVGIATADEAVKLDRQSRGVSKESLKDASFFKKRMEEVRAVLIFVVASGGMLVAASALSRALLTKIRPPSLERIKAVRELLDKFEEKLGAQSEELADEANRAFARIRSQLDEFEKAVPQP